MRRCVGDFYAKTPYALSGKFLYPEELAWVLAEIPVFILLIPGCLALNGGGGGRGVPVTGRIFGPRFELKFIVRQRVEIICKTAASFFSLNSMG